MACRKNENEWEKEKMRGEKGDLRVRVVRSLHPDNRYFILNEHTV